MRWAHRLIGAAGGLLATAFFFFLLPGVTEHITGSIRSVPAILLFLYPVAIILGILLTDALYWTGCWRNVRLSAGASIPWLAVLVIAATFLLTPGRHGMTGTPLGPAKLVFSGSFILGVALYSFFFLPPLIARYKPGRIAAGFFFIMTLLAVPISTQPPNESDETDYVAASIALLETGTTRVDVVTRRGFVEDFYFGNLGPSWSYYNFLIIEESPPYRYSLRMPLYPMILSPFTGLGNMTNTPWLRWFIVHIPGVAAYGLLVLAAVSFLKLRQAESPWPLWIFAFSTPFLYFACNTQPEIWMAAGVTAALFFIERSSKSAGHAFAAAIVIAALPLFHERMITISAPLFCFLFYYSPGRRLRISVAAAGIFSLAVLAYLATQQFSFPSAAPHAYGKTQHLFTPLQWASNVIYHLFSVEAGLVVRLPAFGVLFAGLFRLNSVAEKAGAVCFAIYFMVIVTYPDGRESWPHLRYLVPALPLLLPAIMNGANRILEIKHGRYVLAGLLVLQLVVTLPFLAVPQLWRSFI